MHYISLLSASLLIALNFAISKTYQKKNGTHMRTSLIFTFIAGALTAAFFFVFNGMKVSVTPFSLIMVFLNALTTTAYTLISFTLLKLGSMALYSLFLMSGGMVLPFIWGVAFLGEPIKLFNVLGLILILAGVILSNFNPKNFSFKVLLLCIAVFVLNGFTSITSKVHQVETVYACVSGLEFVVLGGVMRFVLSAIVLLFVRREPTEKQEEKGSFKLSLLLIVGSVLASGLSFFLMLVSAVAVPATVLYPFTSGGSIILSTLIARVLFKEKLNVRLILSIVLCCVGMVMFV